MKSRVRLFSAALTLLFTVAMLLALTADKSQAANPTVITFWHAMSKNRGETINNLVARFNSLNPDIKVVPKFIGAKGGHGNDYNALYTNILENLAKQTPPDVAQVYENWTTQFIEIDALTPVEDFFNGPNGLDQYSVGDFVDVFRQANTFTDNSGKNRIYTLPFNKSIYVLYYNRSVFKSLNLTPPKTWEELRKDAKIIAKKKGIPGLAFSPSVDIFGHYLYTNGGTYITPEGKVNFGGERGIRDVNYWVNLVHTDRSAKATFDAKKEFASGKAGMYMETTSNISGFEKSKGLNFGVMPIPTGTTKAYQFAGTNLAIFKRPESETGDANARQMAAWKFIRFMTSPDITTDFAISTGYLPVRKSAEKSEKYSTYIKQHPNYQIGLNCLKNATVQPRVASWETIRGILDDTLIMAIGRRATPEDAILRATSLANDMLYSNSGAAQ